MTVTNRHLLQAVVGLAALATLLCLLLFVREGANARRIRGLSHRLERLAPLEERLVEVTGELRVLQDRTEALESGIEKLERAEEPAATELPAGP